MRSFADTAGSLPDSLERHDAEESIDDKGVAGFDERGRVLSTGDAGKAVFPRENATVGQSAGLNFRFLSEFPKGFMFHFHR